MKTDRPPNDLLWKNISALPYFRGFLRAVEGGFYQDIEITEPVLDLGCGDGHFSWVTFGERDYGLIGIDPDLNSLIEASQYPVFHLLICAQGNQLPFPTGFFTTTVSNSVLEHIDNVDAVLIEANRVMKPEGELVVCVPNDNFTQNLSVARFLNHIGFKFLANKYQNFFNKISRHFHPDTEVIWMNRLRDAGFKVNKAWNYFTRKSLSILEWGHYFGLPSWINRKFFGRWVLFPSFENPLLTRIYYWLKGHVESDQESPDGAYSFFITTKE